MSDAAQLFLAALRGTRVRLLKPSESLPASFEVGFDQLGQLDPSWVWVAERRGQIEGCIVASPCHGVALIWRLFCVPGSNCMLRLCRQFMRDCRARGLAGYMTLMDTDTPAQAQLQHIIERCGGGTKGPKFTLMASPLVREGV